MTEPPIYGKVFTGARQYGEDIMPAYDPTTSRPATITAGGDNPATPRITPFKAETDFLIFWRQHTDKKLSEVVKLYENRQPAKYEVVAIERPAEQNVETVSLLRNATWEHALDFFRETHRRNPEYFFIGIRRQND